MSSLSKKQLLAFLVIVQSFLGFGLSNAFAEFVVHAPSGFYVNLGLGESSYNADQMSGFQIVAGKSQERPLNKSSVTDFKPFFILAAGYANDDLPIRGEVEYLQTSKLNYSVDVAFSDLLSPQLFDLHSKISSQAILLNGYVDAMGKYSNFMPYFLLGVGYASNKAEWTSGYLFPIERLSGSDKKNAFAWQIGVGSRIRITDNFFADLGVRYANLGRMQFQIEDVGIKAKELRSIQFALSLTVFFGDQSRPAPSLINDDVD